MKRIFSFLVTLILVSSNFGTAFAQENQTSELQKILNEGHREIGFQNGTFNGGFTVLDGETPEEAEKRFYEEHQKFLNFQTKKTQVALWLRSADETQKTMNEQLLTELQDAKGAEIYFFPATTNEQTNSTQIAEKQNFLYTTRSSNQPWAPYKGSLDINQSYVSNEFYFNNITAFNANRTYEHETQVYDKNYADYAGYWNSNMPNAYYDTPFMDRIDTFTVGSSNTQNFEAHKKYTTYMSLKPGSSNSSLVIVKGQIGHRNPNWCHSTWCIWPDATSDGLTRVYAPVGISWYK